MIIKRPYTHVYLDSKQTQDPIARLSLSFGDISGPTFVLMEAEVHEESAEYAPVIEKFARLINALGVNIEKPESYENGLCVFLIVD